MKFSHRHVSRAFETPSYGPPLDILHQANSGGGQQLDGGLVSFWADYDRAPTEILHDPFEEGGGRVFAETDPHAFASLDTALLWLYRAKTIRFRRRIASSIEAEDAEETMTGPDFTWGAIDDPTAEPLTTVDGGTEPLSDTGWITLKRCYLNTAPGANSPPEVLINRTDLVWRVAETMFEQGLGLFVVHPQPTYDDDAETEEELLENYKRTLKIRWRDCGIPEISQVAVGGNGPARLLHTFANDSANVTASPQLNRRFLLVPLDEGYDSAQMSVEQLVDAWDDLAAEYLIGYAFGHSPDIPDTSPDRVYFQATISLTTYPLLTWQGGLFQIGTSTTDWVCSVGAQVGPFVEEDGIFFFELESDAVKTNFSLTRSYTQIDIEVLEEF